MAGGDPARLSPFTAADGRHFAWTVGGAFVVLAGVSRWRGHAAAPLALAVLGALLLAGGLLAPGRLGPAYRAWMRLALALSRVTTPILMALVYFAVLTPTGVLMRLLGRRPLTTPPRASAWVQRPAGSRRSDLRRQF